MTAEIKIEVSFHKLLAHPLIKNCERCHFGRMDMCFADIKGLMETCCYGQMGYWVFGGGIKGIINEHDKN